MYNVRMLAYVNFHLDLNISDFQTIELLEFI